MAQIDRINGLVGALGIKAPVKAATTASITLFGLQTVDGVSLAAGDRVLVKDQSDGAENGVYATSATAWAREPDFDGNRDVVTGTMLHVTNGTTNGGRVYKVSTTDDPIIVGITSLSFTNALISDSASVSFTQEGSGAVARAAQDKMREIFSVKDFGASGDGTTDDTVAIQTAINAVTANASTAALYFPSGTYIISGTLTCDPTIKGAKVLLYGDGQGVSIIKAKAGFTATKLLHFGAAGTTTRMQGCGIVGLGFGGNNLPSSGGIAGVYLYNAYRCVFSDITVDNFGTGGVGDGIASYGNVAGVSGDPCNQGNTFYNIYTRNNGGAGQYYRGEKSSVFDMLQSDGNGVQGFFWDSESITAGAIETTECVIGAALAKNNTGVGFAFSGIAKFSIGNLEAYINGSVGVLFSDTRSGTTAPNLYSSIGSIVSRNNAGALANSIGSNANYCQGIDIGSIVHVGGKGLGVSETEAAAVVIVGWNSCTIGRINSQLNIGTCLRVIDQTGSRYSTAVTFGEVMLVSNGSANATLNHGVSIEGTSSLITINKLHSANAYTTVAKSSYEVVTAVTAKVSINNAYVYATDAGRELSIGNQSNVSFGGASNIRGVQAERKVTGLAAASAVTAYGSYANEFWDNNATPRKYARMGDSSLRHLGHTATTTFTPTLTFATVGDLSVTYSAQLGRSTVIGNRCFVDITVTASAFTHTTASGGFRIAGLPIAAASGIGSIYSGVPYWTGVTKAGYSDVSCSITAGQTYLDLFISGSGGVVAQLAPATVLTGGTPSFRFQFSYEIDLPLA